MVDQLTVAAYRALLEAAADKAEPRVREFMETVIGAARAAKAANLDPEAARDIAFAAVDRVMNAMTEPARMADALLDEREPQKH